MKVRAKSLGYYGDLRRREGDVFELVDREVGSLTNRRFIKAEAQFSESWMEKIEGESSPSVSTPQPPATPHRGRPKKSNVI